MSIGVISISTNQRREPPTPATVTGASEGVSLFLTDVQLGQPVGAVGNPALITIDREIPMDFFTNINIIANGLAAADLQLSINPILFNWVFNSALVQPQFQMNAIDAGSSWNLFYDPAADTWFQGGPGANVTVESFTLFNVGGGSATPTAQLEIGGGGSAAGQAQLKFRGPNLLATPEAGAMEFNGTNIFFTRVATRETMWTGNSGAAAPALTGGGVPASFYGTGGVNYLGTPNNWAQVNIGGTNFKIPLYT